MLDVMEKNAYRIILKTKNEHVSRENEKKNDTKQQQKQKLSRKQHLWIRNQIKSTLYFSKNKSNSTNIFIEDEVNRMDITFTNY